MSDEKPPAGAVRLARVAGVPVYLDRTWLLLAAFIAWTGWQAGSALGTRTAIAYAVWLVVGILVAVLGHEVAHALAGRLLGFRVHRIMATLWGGHTSYDGTGITPARAAGVAVAGPLANVALAVVGYAAHLVLPFPASEFAWSFVALNVLLAGFNLLPGLPLDGGQLVESLVWGLTGRRDRGLVVAGWCGRLLAVGLVLWFVVRPLALRAGGSPDVLTLVLGLVMAWILWSGATAAINRAPFERLVSHVRIDEVVQAVAVVALTTSLGDLPRDGRQVLALDEQGRPTLVLTTPDGVADLGALDPGTPLSSLVVRLPDDAVVEVGPQPTTEVVIRALALSRQPLVVLTDGGAVSGVVTAQRVNAVAEGTLRRN